MIIRILFVATFLFSDIAISKTIIVDKITGLKTITEAVLQSVDGDTILVKGGVYKEGNIRINKSVVMKGIDMPLIDGEKKYENVTITANNVHFSGFKIQHSGQASMDDPGGIKVINSNNVQIVGNILYDNFFGIYLQESNSCTVKNNIITGTGVDEQLIGNGIHCWKCDSILIIANKISGHRDGIYFEFVTNSLIWRNAAIGNIRYGLHFMFSHKDTYITNIFRKNGAGVAVMFTRNVCMINNFFEQNWGDAAYGLLLKEISDSYISGNKFQRNTSGIYMEGTSRIEITKNEFRSNGWGMKIQASCMENNIYCNNFRGNSFDISTNGTLVLNVFYNNYWDKYEGYDLNRDGVGDVSFHPLSLFSVVTENNPSSMLLYQSFMVKLLDKSERVAPSLTPDNFIDETPLMKPVQI